MARKSKKQPYLHLPPIYQNHPLKNLCLTEKTEAIAPGAVPQKEETKLKGPTPCREEVSVYEHE
ncbi:MAG: hypothetical protein [Microvirus sp.]|nr:MAG: hypothetical protein [Microvirus sp.]